MGNFTPSTPRFAILKSLYQVDWRSWLPSRGNVIFTLVIVFALFWAQAANALPWSQPSQSPTSTGTWPYQGRLADSAGTPITATVPMVFRLYNAAIGGVHLWEESWIGPNSVQVSDGLFNVMLGSLNAIPQSLVNNNGSLWLGITVGTDNEMEPRIQLGSVPYAVQALTVPDGSITTAKLENGSVTQAKLGADISFIPPDGSISTNKIISGAVTGEKLANQAVTVNKLGTDVQSWITSQVNGITTEQLAPGAANGFWSTVGTTDVTTNSATLTPLPEMKLTVQTKGQPIEITFETGYAISTGTDFAVFAIYIDGVEKVKHAVRVFTASQSTSTHLTWVEKNLPAGNHTIEVYWGTNTASPVLSIRSATNTWEKRILIVHEYRR